MRIIITQDMLERAYELGMDVIRARSTRQAAINKLMMETKMNPASAADHIDNLRHMLKGSIYKRTLSFPATRYFLERIRRDFVGDAYKNAVTAFQKHLDYFDSLGHGKQRKLRQLLLEHLDTIKTEQGLFGEAGPPHDAPEASDLAAPPDRVLTIVSRILRDTALANRVKALHNYECEICGHTILLADGSRYAEGHHLRPLGKPHNGPDKFENIICLCPNHHAACDLGAIDLDPTKFRTNKAHQLGQEFIDYHNQKIR